MAEKCQKSGRSFLQYLDSLLPQNASSNGTKRFGRAIKFQFQQPKLDQFTAEINRLQSALTLATVLAFRTSAKADHQEILAHLQELQKEKSSNDQSLQNTIHTLIGATTSRTEQKLDELDSLVQKCLASIDDCRRDMSKISEANVLTWLSFRQNTWRYAEVSPAYKETYAWIFEPPSVGQAWSSLEDHLIQNVSKPYFINGKAGSGKSTLMKYILDHSRTKECLQKWASADKMELLTTHFFFWNLGTPLQKTAPGLLRSLLWTVLTRKPELIPIAFPNQYQDLDWAVEGPKYVEVKQAWKILLERCQKFLKIAIFVDGIDELDGDPSDLTDFIWDICSPSVKVVASSRPINTSLQAFSSCPSLRLQDLTRRDIELYIQGNLATHNLMIPVLEHHPQTSEIIFSELKEKAEGVFLWVILVVTLLLKGLVEGDDVEDLLTKLRSLPGDLKDLYRRMMSQIPLEYQTQAAEIFQIVRSWQNPAGQPLFTSLLHFALRPPPESIAGDPKSLRQGTLEWHCKQLSARLQSRCCGLLELAATSDTQDPKGGNSQILRTRVDYIHRTVGEFLEMDEVKATMENILETPFDPYEQLTAACLSMVQLTSSQCYRDEQLLEGFVSAMFKLCGQTPREKRHKLGKYCAEFDRVMVDWHMDNKQHEKLPFHEFDGDNPRGYIPLDEGKVNDTSQNVNEDYFARRSLWMGFYLNEPWINPIPVLDEHSLLGQALLHRKHSMLAHAAWVGFPQYLEECSHQRNFDPVFLLSVALKSWLLSQCYDFPVGDKIDALTFLLTRAMQTSGKRLQTEIIEYCKKCLPAMPLATWEMTPGKAKSPRFPNEAGQRIYVSCIIVATGFWPGTWLDKYDIDKLREISQDLRLEEDADVQHLGERLLQAIEDNLKVKEVCAKCQIPGHTPQACRRNDNGNQKPKGGRNTGRRKRKNRKRSEGRTA